MAIKLTDDGTLDTVLRCSECGEEFRYSYANSDWPDPGTEDAPTLEAAYDAFVEWAIEDATNEHECPLAFDEGAEGENAARELGELDEDDSEQEEEE